VPPVRSTRALAEPGFARALLAWYDRERRDLPWRRHPSAYRTLVSELMLQQTGVATVVPYFERFLARFPTLQDLAAASEDQVLSLWSGLGYYSRARHLHRAARVLVDERGGQLPSQEDELRRLPGVGAYTAAAVAAIAFSRPTLPVDGNVARVLARLLGERRTIDNPLVRAELRRRGRPLVPGQRPGDFAQALMELGALRCVPRLPRCPDCPVGHFCRARAQAATAAIPARTTKPARRRMDLVCAVFERRGRVLLVQRPAGSLLGRTWLLPLESLRSRETIAQAVRRLAAELGLTLQRSPTLLGRIRHIFTHRDARASVFRARATGRVRRADARWVRDNELDSLGLSSFARKMIALARSTTAGPLVC
jgi:A/G-specific adenine glycosylase